MKLKIENANLRLANRKDKSTIKKVLTESFKNDPCIQWLIEQSRHKNKLDVIMDYTIDETLENGYIYVTDDNSAVAMGQDQDDVVLAPYTTVMKRIAAITYFNNISASARSEAVSDAAQDEMETILRKSHKLSEDADNDFRIRSQKELLTMQHHFYQDEFVRHGISVIVPSLADQKIIHNIIFPELEEGIVIPEKKMQIVSLCNNIIESAQCDGIILGCTELPLMLGEHDFNITVLNTTGIHIDVIVENIFQK